MKNSECPYAHCDVGIAQNPTKLGSRRLEGGQAPAEVGCGWAGRREDLWWDRAFPRISYTANFLVRPHAAKPLRKRKRNFSFSFCEQQAGRRGKEERRARGQN